MHVQYELVVNLLPCRLGHLHMALFARSLAFFVPGGGPSFTTLHSLVMWFTVNFVLCSTMYPRIEKTPSAGASLQQVVPSLSKYFSFSWIPVYNKCTYLFIQSMI